MVTFLITSLFIIAFLAVAIYFWQKPASTSNPEGLLPPSPGRGLFADAGEHSSHLLTEQTSADTATLRADLITRAANDDKSALVDAHNGADSSLYGDILNALVNSSDSDAKLLSLVSYVTRQELPVNEKLATSFIASWRRQPDRSSTSKMLHIAALSDSAKLYQSAVEATMQLWLEGRLAEISAPELRAILEGEFWILSANTRSSGAGFLLKRTLANARRKLEAAPND